MSLKFIHNALVIKELPLQSNKYVFNLDLKVNDTISIENNKDEKGNITITTTNGLMNFMFDNNTVKIDNHLIEKDTSITKVDIKISKREPEMATIIPPPPQIPLPEVPTMLDESLPSAYEDALYNQMFPPPPTPLEEFESTPTRASSRASSRASLTSKKSNYTILLIIAVWYYKKWKDEKDEKDEKEKKEKK
eukprot:Pgem_evm15s12025